MVDKATPSRLRYSLQLLLCNQTFFISEDILIPAALLRQTFEWPHHVIFEENFTN